MLKQCFKCGQSKELADFYKHSKMADGHLNKCKECTKSDVAEHRLKNIDRIRAYDRERGNRQATEYLNGYRRIKPKIAKAYGMVAYHLRKGHIVQLPCEICGSVESVAHHDDYDYPLSIRWLCQAHHKQWHAANGPGRNSTEEEAST